MGEGRQKYLVWGTCVLLAAITFSVYIRVIKNDFLSYDDNEYIKENPQTQAGLNFNTIRWAFTTNRTGYWHPMTWLSLMLDSQFCGTKPWGYHLTNLFLHIANVLILFAVLRVMTGAMWRSAFAAAVFAVHPLNVESVAWIAERKNVLSTMFWLLTIVSYWKYTKERNAGWYLLTLFLCAMGLMSKPMVVTLPFTLLLLDYWPLERLKSLKDCKTAGRLIFEKVPFFMLSAILSIITFWGQKNIGALVKFEQLSPSIQLTNSIISYAKYISKCFWPSRMGVFYPFDKDMLILKVVVSIAVLAAISVLVFKFTKKYKYLLSGWLWYLGTLVPVIGIVQAGSQSMADRYAYVPLIGVFVMISWGVKDATEPWKRRTQILRATSVIVIAVLSIISFIQLGHWRDSITMYKHTIGVTKNNSLMYYCLGLSYFNESNFQEAREYLENAIRIRPDNTKAYEIWGSASLACLAQEKEGKIRQELLGQIKDKLLKAESIESGSCAYNLACVYALLGDKENCQKWLEVGEKTGNLETRERAMADKDLESVRNEEWFKEIKWGKALGKNNEGMRDFEKAK